MSETMLICWKNITTCHILLRSISQLQKPKAWSHIQLCLKGAHHLHVHLRHYYCCKSPFLMLSQQFSFHLPKAQEPRKKEQIGRRAQTWHSPVCCCRKRCSCWWTCSSCRRTGRAARGCACPAARGAGPGAAGIHAMLAGCWGEHQAQR